MKILLLLALVSLTACVRQNEHLDGIKINVSGIYKFYDEEEGVVCYTHYSTGIACLKKEPGDAK